MRINSALATRDSWETKKGWGNVEDQAWEQGWSRGWGWGGIGIEARVRVMKWNWEQKKNPIDISRLPHIKQIVIKGSCARKEKWADTTYRAT